MNGTSRVRTMAAITHALVRYEQSETSPEVVTIAGSWPAPRAGPGRRTRSIRASSCAGSTPMASGLFEVTHTHIEVYARPLEDEG